jgi:hypothetical protein
MYQNRFQFFLKRAVEYVRTYFTFSYTTALKKIEAYLRNIPYKLKMYPTYETIGFDTGGVTLCYVGEELCVVIDEQPVNVIIAYNPLYGSQKN